MEYTNSPLVEFTQLSPYNSGQRTHAIDRITPHCVVGQITAKALGEWFSGNNRQASSNYGIGLNGEVGMYCPENMRSWCSSSPANDQRAITIECASDTKHPYAFRDVVYQKLILLCTDICRRNGKKKLLWISDKAKALAYNPAQDEMLLTVHRWFFDTDCPGQWMIERMGDLAEKVTAALAQEESAPIDEPQQTVDEPQETVDEQPVAEHGLQARELAALTNVQIVDTVGPLCTEDQRKTGILASVTMAQFILESGYCRTELAKASNNCFGMKGVVSGNTWPGSVWREGNVCNIAMDEYRADGTKYTIWEDFRKYPCIEDSIADHSAYLLGAKNGNALRYAGLSGCTDYRKATQIIKDGGYATAPDYVSVLCQLIEMWGLWKWDVPQDERHEKQDEQQSEPLIPDTQSVDTVTISVSDWNAIKAAIVVAYQAVRKHDDVG